MSARRACPVLGLLGAAALLLLYGPELFVHGSPITVAWLREHVGNPGLVAVNVAAGAAFLLLLPYRREGGATWRSRGAFLAFFVALMAEMFGWPLLVYLLAPLVDVPVLGGGHHPLGHAGAMAGTWMSTIGLLLVVLGWRRIHGARGLVTDGLYARMRHPQYAGLLCFTGGWLVHWPTVLTLVLWPLLAAAYVRLALAEERALAAEWGDAYRAYARRTPRFVPRLVPGRAA
jgi:protein-S-isoprenylcysteine O-methyltransferase Ste14